MGPKTGYDLFMTLKSTHRSKRSRHGKWWRRAVRAEHAALLLVSTAGLTLLLALAGAYYQIGRHGSENTGVQASQLAYKDLDLSIARQATYSNTEIVRVRDLGVASGVRRVVFKFAVPKDKLTEYGLMTLPAALAPKSGYPVIILAHGYATPHSYSTTASYIGDMEFYSRHGFAVLKPDFRGQGLSLSEGAAEGSYYSMAYNTDVMSLIASIKVTPYLNKNKINIWGHSMGAYIALRAAVLSPDIKTAIILSGPVGTPEHMYGDYSAISDMSNPVALRIRDGQIALHGTPLSDPSYWDKTSPLNYLVGNKVYFQIHVGTGDKIVPPGFSADLDNALLKARKTHGYFVYPGAPHGLGAQRGLIFPRTLQVLAK